MDVAMPVATSVRTAAFAESVQSPTDNDPDYQQIV